MSGEPKSNRTMYDPPQAATAKKMVAESGRLDGSEMPIKMLDAPPEPPKDRIGSTGSIYHQNPGRDALRLELCLKKRNITSGEQPYQRRLTITEDVKPLDLNWLTDVGVSIVVIANEEGKNPQVIPSPEEIEDIAKRKVLLFTCEESNNPIEIWPGDTQFVSVMDPARMQVCCEHGSARCTITLFPK